MRAINLGCLGVLEPPRRSDRAGDEQFYSKTMDRACICDHCESHPHSTDPIHKVQEVVLYTQLMHAVENRFDALRHLFGLHTGYIYPSTTNTRTRETR